MTRLSQMQGPMTYQLSVPSGTILETALYGLWIAPHNCTITSVKLVPDAAITANASHFLAFTLKNGATSVATRSWAATNSVAATAESMTLSATLANRNLTAGDTITLDRAVTGNGLASPRMGMVITVQVR